MYSESTAAPADKPEAGLSDLAEEFQQFVADIEELIRSTTALSAADWTRAKAKLQARITQARESVNEIGEISGTLFDRARRSLREADTYVHEQPWQAIGITAAVSLLVGFLLGRRG